MKKIGKNTKLYLIGMIIGGITLGITTVIADTIINSTSVAYKTTTVKAAIDELYGLAELKPRVEALESHFTGSVTSRFVDNGLQLGKSGSSHGWLDFYHSGVMKGNISANPGGSGLDITGRTDENTYGVLRLGGASITSNGYEIGKVSSSSFASNSLVETGTGSYNHIMAWGPVVTFYTGLTAKSKISAGWIHNIINLPEGFRPTGYQVLTCAYGNQGSAGVVLGKTTNVAIAVDGNVGVQIPGEIPNGGTFSIGCTFIK